MTVHSADYGTSVNDITIQLRPYEDPERGHVDPYYEDETRTLIVGFLAQLNALLIEAHNDQHASGQTGPATGSSVDPVDN